MASLMSSHHDHAGVTFDELAKTWDERPGTAELTAAVGGFLEQQAWFSAANGLKVLEFGAGSGAHALRLLGSGHVAVVVCTDLAQKMVDVLAAKVAAKPELAGRILPCHITSEVGDISDVAEVKQHGPFELIVAAFVLHHTPDPARVLSNLRRHLAPGGHLVIAEFSLDAEPLFDPFAKKEGEHQHEHHHHEHHHHEHHHHEHAAGEHHHHQHHHHEHAAGEHHHHEHAAGEPHHHHHHHEHSAASPAAATDAAHPAAASPAAHQGEHHHHHHHHHHEHHDHGAPAGHSHGRQRPGFAVAVLTDLIEKSSMGKVVTHQPTFPAGFPIPWPVLLAIAEAV